jgi:hypothetical protein
MKKRISVVLVLLVGLIISLPSTGYTWRNGYYYGRGGCYGGCGYSNDWGWAAAIAGSVIAAGVIASVIANQKPLIYIDQRSAYAYPDPDFTAKYGATPPANSPPGEWVLVPGQWVNGVWVDDHEVWVSRDGN